MPGHEVHEEDFALWSTTTRPSGLITVTKARFSSDPDEFEVQLRFVLMAYQRAELPANWFWGPSGTPEDLGKRLRKKHYMGPRYLPGMVSDLSTWNPEASAVPTELTTDWSEFDSTIHPLASFFPKAQKKDCVKMLRELSEAEPKHVFTIMARSDGVPASCVTAFIHEDTVGIYDVVTLAEFRNRGASKAALSMALSLAKDHGVKYATLQAYHKATGLYEKLGFASVCRFTSMYYSRERMRLDREANQL